MELQDKNNNIIKFHLILNESELKNSDLVQNYLEYSLKFRKPKKSFKFYINITKIFDYYPKLIKNILDNIPKLGYYKDYFYILSFCRNSELSEYIFKLIIQQLDQDIQNYNNFKEISTLGKWLPREKSRLDKKINFVDKFNSKFFPNHQINTARKKYRQLKSKLNKRLGTLEVNLCSKNYKINFDKVSPYSLKKNMVNLIKHPEIKSDLNKYNYNQLSKLNLSDFINKITTEPVDLEIINKIWSENQDKYLLELPYINKLINNSIGIFDLSRETFNNNFQNFILGIILILSEIKSNKIIIADNNLINFPDNLNLVEKSKYILKYIGPNNKLDIYNYYGLYNTDNKTKNILVFSSLEPNNLEKLKSNNIIYFQYKIGKSEIIIYKGSKINRLPNYNINIKNKTKNPIINNLIQDYFNKNNPINKIIPGIILILILIFGAYFFSRFFRF